MRRPLAGVTICLIVLIGCVPEDGTGVAPEHGSANIIEPIETTRELEKDQIRALVFNELEKRFVQFAPANIPIMELTHLELTDYNYVTSERTISIHGRILNDTKEASDELLTLLEILKTTLYDFEFDYDVDGKTFEITGEYRVPRAKSAPIDEIGTLSEIKKLQLKRAIPYTRDDESFLQSLADIASELGLSINHIVENEPPNIDEHGFERFQVTIEAEGLMRDLGRLVNEIPKMSRLTTLVSANLHKTETREGIELGKGIFVLEVYYLE